jgi:hypothetical protein
MTEYQPELMTPPDNKYPGSGPVFEAGPGWGKKLNEWFKKNFAKWILPVVGAVIIAAIILNLYKNNPGATATPTVANTNLISQPVQKGDSRTLVARHALAQYLQMNPDQSLTNGQKLFIEEVLRRKIDAKPLAVGTTIEFSVSDIESAISQAKQLAPSTLAKWEIYAKNVRF